MYTYQQGNASPIRIPASAVLKALRLTTLDGVEFPVVLDATTQNIAETDHVAVKHRITITRTSTPPTPPPCNT